MVLLSFDLTSRDNTVLASSMKLEYPLNDALPNIQHARDRLLARIFHYRLDSEFSAHTTDADYALLYAYGRFARSFLL